MSNNIDKIIECQKVTKNFGEGDSEVMALRGVDLQIYKTEFVIIFGPSGSGKSTLLNIIASLDAPTTGDIFIDGQDPYQLDDKEHSKFHRQKIGMVFQAYNLIPTLTVIQNITLPLAFDKLSKHEREKRGDALLEKFDLMNLRDRLPTEISGGQQQRIGIIRALIAGPPIIIADEPTGNLDSVTSEKVMRLFKELNNTFDTTIVVVTHDPNQFEWADRVIHFLDGKIIKQTIYSKKSLIAKDAGYKTEYGKEAADFINKIEKYEKEKKKEEEYRKRPFYIAWQHREKLDKVTQRILSFLKAVLTDEQLYKIGFNELEITIRSIDERINGKIGPKKLIEILDRPSKKNGAGLYKQTARKISDNLELIVNLKK